MSCDFNWPCIMNFYQGCKQTVQHSLPYFNSVYGYKAGFFRTFRKIFFFLGSVSCSSEQCLLLLFVNVLLPWRWMLILARRSSRCWMSLASFLLGLCPVGGSPLFRGTLATSISRSPGRVGSSRGENKKINKEK